MSELKVVSFGSFSLSLSRTKRPERGYGRARQRPRRHRPEILVPQDSTIKGLSEPAKGVSPAPLPSTAFEFSTGFSSPKRRPTNTSSIGRSSLKRVAAKSSRGKKRIRTQQVSNPAGPVFSQPLHSGSYQPAGPTHTQAHISAQRETLHSGPDKSVCTEEGRKTRKDPDAVGCVTFSKRTRAMLPMEQTLTRSLPTYLWEMWWYD